MSKPTTPTSGNLGLQYDEVASLLELRSPSRMGPITIYLSDTEKVEIFRLPTSSHIFVIRLKCSEETSLGRTYRMISTTSYTSKWSLLRAISAMSRSLTP